MKTAPIPVDEQNRLASLQNLNILDTESESTFDSITQLASFLTGRPIALISLIDESRQWFKSKVGLDANETPRDVSFCGHAINSDDIFDIPDALHHPDFCDNPLVTGSPHVIAYTGVPLKLSDGKRVGTLCVIDQRAGEITPTQKQNLRLLATQVVALLESRVDRFRLLQTIEQLNEAQAIAKIGFWRFDLQTKQQTWSSEHYKIFEIPEPQSEKTLYETYRSRIHPEDLRELDRLSEIAIQTGESLIFNHRVMLDGGRRIKYVQGVGQCIRNSLGQPIAFAGTCRDRTREVEAEFEKKSILEIMIDGLVVQDESGKIIQHNRSATQILGLNSDQLCRRTSFDPRWRAIREDGTDFPGEEHPAMLALKTGEMQKNVLMGIQWPDGQQRWITINSIPFESSVGRKALTTFSDITEQRLKEEELKVSRTKAIQENKLASLGELAAGVAHEVNNPLAIISAGLQLLNKYRQDEKKFIEKIEVISKSIYRISKIVTGLKKFSRTSGKSSAELHSLLKVINETRVLLEPRLNLNSIELRLDINPQAYIKFDDVELEQVIVNLINNSIDAIENSNHPWIQLKTEYRDSKWVLIVSDSGEGIPREFVHKMFQPFATTKPIGKGTGLGLSIVKGMVESYEGQIEYIQDAPNTTFEITFQSSSTPF